ncbi:MAG: phosphodiesterase [Pseudomonadota bacterium]
MRFLQITDTHFVPAGETLYDLDPQARLEGLLELAARDHPDAAFILITGDLAHHGEVAAYEALWETLTAAHLPVHLMMGNHDSRAPFASVFPEAERIEGGFVQFEIAADDASLLCLDTLLDIPGEHAGDLCKARLGWLDARLAAIPPGRDWLLALHHPPLPLSLPNMDDIALAPRWADALWEVIAERQPAAIFCGHVHRPIHGTWRGVPFHIQRGVNHQVAYAPERTPTLTFADAPPALSDICFESGNIVIHTRELAPARRRFPA